MIPARKNNLRERPPKTLPSFPEMPENKEKHHATHR